MDRMTAVKNQLSAGSVVTIQLNSTQKNTRKIKPQKIEQVKIATNKPPLQVSYQYNETLRQVVITMQNPETGGIVKQIPPEQVQKVAEALLREVNQLLDTAA